MDLTKLTKAQLIALIATNETAETAEPSVASQHWRARDIACSAKRPCKRTFRTEKGRDWHVANVTH